MAFSPFQGGGKHDNINGGRGGKGHHRSSFYVLRRPVDGPQFNLPHRMTAGLRYLYQHVFTSASVINQANSLIAKQSAVAPSQHPALNTSAIALAALSSVQAQLEQQQNPPPLQAPPTSSPTATLPLLYARYKPVALLGKGTFSQLIVAEDLYHPTKKHFAIKIMNRNCDYIGIQECQKIQLLNNVDNDDNAHIVRMIGHFYFGNHFCVVLELLGCSLLQFMRKFPNERVPLDYVRKIALQLVGSFAFLQKSGVIHADLKPENVLLASQSIPRGNISMAQFHVSSRVKLVDFGNAMTPDDTSAYFDDFQVQSLYYRAPEVLLGSWSFGYPIDMWSLGCVLAELCIGRPLFRVRTTQELFLGMHQLLGPFPGGVFTSCKFYSTYVIDASFEVTAFSKADEVAINLRRENNLKKLLNVKDANFVSFIASLLNYDPSQRLSPKEALFHPFLCSLFPFNFVFGNLTTRSFDDKTLMRLDLSTTSKQHDKSSVTDGDFSEESNSDEG
eukprot:TRINITY_DN51833_c0_g1_i2.p1 TRINITY_DN51833_c0_g1~~TRINITY_DN51833_c0_g1_i2.p1  ORF type:complete len:502 (+),score=82.79 TRINITY_DN51833_c0_g1_i2:990-2495(+)